MYPALTVCGLCMLFLPLAFPDLARLIYVCSPQSDCCLLQMSERSSSPFYLPSTVMKLEMTAHSVMPNVQQRVQYPPDGLVSESDSYIMFSDCLAGQSLSNSLGLATRPTLWHQTNDLLVKVSGLGFNMKILAKIVTKEPSRSEIQTTTRLRASRLASE